MSEEERLAKLRRQVVALISDQLDFHLSLLSRQVHLQFGDLGLLCPGSGRPLSLVRHRPDLLCLDVEVQHAIGQRVTLGGEVWQVRYCPPTSSPSPSTHYPGVLHQAAKPGRVHHPGPGRNTNAGVDMLLTGVDML